MTVSTLLAVFYVITSTSVMTAVWYSLYQTLKTRFNLDGEYTTRIIAGFHGALCVLLAFACMSRGLNPLQRPGEPNTWMEIITMQISVGYFVYDFLWCVKYQPEPKIMLVHHLASIFAMCYIIVLGRSGAEAIGGLCSMEITNPVLQARWFLRYYDKKNTYLFIFVEYSFFAMFLSVRLIYGSLLLHAVIMSEKTNVIVKMVTTSLFLISLAFVQNICAIVWRRIQRRQQSRLAGNGDPGVSEQSRDRAE
ncbi:Transmembrane protein 136 [Nesidiocoris tenuis]|uniref:Transmembrane protein 136 n=1 Tax=Nesidiocoris tenuis TaxID=355587 RepID=A0ABN7ASD9_9HEMI|nr:Transmembrane protein 136 [Nesidiocoris tenuis]